MKFVPLEKLEDQAGNKYAAVMVAARRARQLNLRRKEEEQEMSEKPGVKVTTIALNELVDGVIRFQIEREGIKG